MKYFERIPAAALRIEPDGNIYAYVGHTVHAGGVIRCAPKMVRANNVKIVNGEAYIYIGGMGPGIAQTVNLPFSVSTEGV